MYTSPYFVAEQELVLKDVATHWDTAATVEAKAYGITFPDWKPVGHKFWPAENGFVMRYRWEGTNVNDGKVMGFYSISFVETNEEAEIVHWSTYVNGVRPVPGGRPSERGVHSTEMSTCRLWRSTSRSTDSVSEDSFAGESPAGP